MDAPPETRVYPHGHEDEFPEERGTPPARRKKTPPGGFPLRDPERVESSDIQDLTANTGVPPSGKSTMGHPVVGAYRPQALKPGNPHSQPPEVFDPGDTVEEWSPEDGSNIVHDLPSAQKGVSDFNDPNPVDAEHVYLLMAKNFPADAIQWVKRAHWIGPVWIPWDRVDQDDRDKWAASHQPEKVKEFQQAIQEHSGHIAPSIMVQEPKSPKAFIVDGHHRALAREKLKQKVLAYVGNINPKDRMAALETHTKQIHQGSDPGNR